VYDAQPFMEECGECVVDPCISPIKVATGTGCPVECELFGCLSYDDWIAKTKNGNKIKSGKDYYVILEANDVIGNLHEGYGILTLRSDYTASLNDAELSDCQFMFGTTDRADTNHLILPQNKIMGRCTYGITVLNQIN